jgi:hypothetical protein
MIRGVILFIVVSLGEAFGGVQNLPALPNGVTAAAVQVDASGNIYVAGAITPSAPKSASDTSDAYVAKLSPDGSQVLWSATLGGSSVDRAPALALGSDGSVYLNGYTTSVDFPTTQGSMQPGLGYSVGQAFAAKLSPAGAAVYATFTGGTSYTLPGSIVVDASGDAFITGTTGLAGFPTTPGSISGLAETAIQLSPAGSANPQAVTIPLDAMGVRTREQNVLIWIQSEN